MNLKHGIFLTEDAQRQCEGRQPTGLYQGLCQIPQEASYPFRWIVIVALSKTDCPVEVFSCVEIGSSPVCRLYSQKSNSFDKDCIRIL